MILAVERYEPSSGNPGGHAPTGFEGHHLVPLRVKHDRRNSDLRQEVLDIDFSELGLELRGVLRGSRVPLKLIEPTSLLGRRFRDELRGEHLAIRRIIPSPPHPGQLDLGSVFLDGFLWEALGPTDGVGTVQHEMADTFRMPDGVRNADRAALRQTHQYEPFNSERIDDRLQVVDPRIERKVIDDPIGQTASPFVVPDISMEPRKFLDPMPPDRAFQIELNVAQPIRRPDERGTVAGHPAGDAYPVFGGTETDLLFQSTPPPGGHCDEEYKFPHQTRDARSDFAGDRTFRYHVVRVAADAASRNCRESQFRQDDVPGPPLCGPSEVRLRKSGRLPLPRLVRVPRRDQRRFPTIDVRRLSRFRD